VKATLGAAVVVLGLVVAALAFRPGPARAQALASLSPGDVAHGKALYDGRCARCHGMKGDGGEGPALVRPYLSYAPDDATLVTVIRSGIPNTGMYGDWTLTDLEARQIAAYVRSLGRVAAAPPPQGDSARGQALFLGKGGCVACHGPRASGTSLGPSLAQVGARRNAQFIRQAIVDPGAALPQGNPFQPAGFHEYLPVLAVAGGDTVHGYRVNESTFVILVRDQTGRLHSFDKTRLDDLVKQFGHSLMPSYRAVFTDRELDDLVAFLARLRGAQP
jgi:cytochrome c oxidase cbb3-type subunit III